MAPRRRRPAPRRTPGTGATAFLDTYDSWDAFVAQASQKGSESLGSLASRRTDNDKWHGCSWNQALKMARTDGYREAIPEAERFSAAVSDSIIAERFATTFEPVYDVTGSTVDIGRYLAGTPECMIEAVPLRIARAGRTVRIVVSCAASSGVPADRIMRRGAAVMALVDVLARAQHPLEVWIGEPVTGDAGRRGVILTKVQQANATLDMGRIMYATAHPSMLRRLMFSAQEQQSETLREEFGITPYGGYGQPTSFIPDDFPDQADSTIVLDTIGSMERWDADYAVSWIEQQLDRIFAD